jgi:hypothetical protein
MPDFAVHEEPRSGGPRGWRRLFLPLRRLLVRILRPVFLRLAEALRRLDDDRQVLAERQDRLGEQVDALLNRGWDQTALLRRVATLEQQVEELMQRLVALEPAGDEAGRGYFTPLEEPAADRPGR